MFLFLLICLGGNAQDWKVYPYMPSGTTITFPTDEAHHPTEAEEWWYQVGHFTGDTSGKEYSFMLTYVYKPYAGYDGIRILNVTDHSDGSFYQDVKPVDYTTLSTTHLNFEADVFLGGTEYWRNLEDAGNNPIPFEYEYFASNGTVTLDFEMVTTKRPLILNGDGYLDQGDSSYTYYFSQTNNVLSGSFTINGFTETITGTSWVDRQYGDFNGFTGERYEWFSLKLSNGMDINVYNIFSDDNLIPDAPEYRILSAYVDESTQYTESDFEIERLQFFCTVGDATCYSKQWRLTSTTNNLDLTFTSLFETNEVLLPIRFFEGSIEISGTVNGVAVTGKGFAELLHHYEHPEIAINSPSGGIYDVSQPISWDLSNPDDGRPIFYDIEYSTDNQNTFLPIASGLTQTSYLWQNPPLNENDEVWFKIIAYSVDGTLTSTTISDAASTATLALTNFSNTVLKAYPNPATQILNVDMSDMVSNINYEVLDISGKVVLRGSEQQVNGLKLDVEALAKGVYFVRLETEKNEDFIKFIKK